MPSFEEWAHVLEVLVSTGGEAAMSTLTSLKVVYVEAPKEILTPRWSGSWMAFTDALKKDIYCRKRARSGNLIENSPYGW